MLNQVGCIDNQIDICLISETKFIQFFPNKQFQIHGYNMLQRNRDKYSGQILFYVDENIPSKDLNLNSTPMAMKLYY